LHASPHCLLLLLFILFLFFYYVEFLESPSKDINRLQQRIPYITNFDHNKQVQQRRIYFQQGFFLSISLSQKTNYNAL